MKNNKVMLATVVFGTVAALVICWLGIGDDSQYLHAAPLAEVLAPSSPRDVVSQLVSSVPADPPVMSSAPALQTLSTGRAETKRNAMELERQGFPIKANRLLPIVMNSAADILEAEGAGILLNEGDMIQPAEVESVDRKAIIRKKTGGSWLYIAQKDRFPILFSTIEKSRRNEFSTQDEYLMAMLLAERADATH